MYAFFRRSKSATALDCEIPLLTNLVCVCLCVCVCTGTPVNRIPIMAKQTLDLYELFRLVVSKGGLVEVINKKLWREITKGLNLPSSITSAAFTLRTQSVSCSVS